jgi:phosphoenolpyruvate-protein phosphotransferase/dihydroxyacetone kinase phosphotransfer subunit
VPTVVADRSRGKEEPGKGLVSLVLVSHSRRLAEGAAELAAAMAKDVRIVPAGGLEPPEEALGTDAVRIAAAIEQAWSNRGVLILMDLGSALLSAELAVNLLPEEHRKLVLLSPAPLVEGAVAAAVAAQLGDPLEKVAADASGGLTGKASQLGGDVSEAEVSTTSREGASWDETTISMELPHGLHARPAAALIRTSAKFDAEVMAANESTGRGPVSARSLNAIATLQVGHGQRLRLMARGPQAQEVLRAVEELARQRFGEPATSPQAAPVSRNPPPAPVSLPDEAGLLAGLPASPGIAFGRIVHLGRPKLVIPNTPGGSPAAELVELERALAKSRRELEALQAATERRSGSYEASIIGAQLLFLEDPDLVVKARRQIEKAQVGAARAWDEVTSEARRSWEQLTDPRMRERAADLDGVSRKVLSHLVGAPEATPIGSGILVADELTPTDTAGLDPANVTGIATARGGPTSHSAILARSLGIPAAVGLGAAVLSIPVGTRALLDGEMGTLLPEPPAALVEAAMARQAVLERTASAARERSHAPALTKDGVLVEVVANIGSVADAKAAALAGADGVGLLRTEFLFQARDSMPDQNTQAAVYEEIAAALGGSRLTIRTLDVGADKPLRYVDHDQEENPALGLRGLRLGLARPKLLSVQLSAILQVAARHPIRVMFPMVASSEEVESALLLLAQLPHPPWAAGVPPMEVGIMVEVPAAAVEAAKLAPLVDFMSLGTNDLAQYTMAADRVNPKVAALADPLQPAVLRLIQLTAAAAEAAGIQVAICGELAGEPTATGLLVGLGVKELSAAPVRLAAVKDAVRQVDSGKARQLAERALALPNAKAVRQLLTESPSG